MNSKTLDEGCPSRLCQTSAEVFELKNTDGEVIELEARIDYGSS